MGVSRSWLDDVPLLDWNNPRQAHRTSRTVLSRLAHDRELLTRLVYEIEHDPARLTECEVHPLINRLVIYQAPDRGFKIRLHMSPGERDLAPHDHKYTFTAFILKGGYVHVWRRRHDEQGGRFTSADISPGIVSVERPGACYTFGWTLIHQTIMLPGTVSLFIRGPRTQARSHAAEDMLAMAKDWGVPAEAGKPEHANGQRPVTVDEYLDMRRQLIDLRLVDELYR